MLKSAKRSSSVTSEIQPWAVDSDMLLTTLTSAVSVFSNAVSNHMSVSTNSLNVDNSSIENKQLRSGVHPALGLLSLYVLSCITMITTNKEFKSNLNRISKFLDI